MILVVAALVALAIGFLVDMHEEGVEPVVVFAAAALGAAGVIAYLLLG